MKASRQWFAGWFASDLIVLWITAMLYLAGAVLPWSACQLAGMTEVFGISILMPFLIWSCSAIAIAAAWTSLGTGAWHWRFLGASWTALCLVIALLGAQSALPPPSGRPYGSIALSALEFGICAFGAQWIASIGSVRILRQRVLTRPPPLRAGQFSTATLLLAMGLVAVLLGSVRILYELWPIMPSLTSPEFDLRVAPVGLIVGCLLPLAAIPAVLTSRAVLILVVPGVLLTLVASRFAFQSESALEAAALFAASVVQLLWVRLCGFRLMRVAVCADTDLSAAVKNLP